MSSFRLCGDGPGGEGTEGHCRPRPGGEGTKGLCCPRLGGRGTKGHSCTPTKVLPGELKSASSDSRAWAWLRRGRRAATEEGGRPGEGGLSLSQEPRAVALVDQGDRS